MHIIFIQTDADLLWSTGKLYKLLSENSHLSFELNLKKFFLQTTWDPVSDPPQGYALLSLDDMGVFKRED